MRYMVMSGTSDSTKVMNYLKKADDQNFILATTVTDYGGKIAENAGATKVITKALKKDDFINVIEENEIDTLIDTTHPFAQIATETAIESAQQAGINYIRYERASTKLPESDLIYEVASFEEGAKKALELLGDDESKLMHLAGVTTLPKIVEVINPKQVIVRVLPNVFSITKTQEAGVNASNIVAMQGTYSEEFNKALMKEYNIKVMLTKESGESGGAEEKINAALDLEIPVVLVRRPVIKDIEKYPVVRSIEELKDII